MLKESRSQMFMELNAQAFAWSLIGQGGMDKANSRAAKALSQGLISQETYDLVIKS